MRPRFSIAGLAAFVALSGIAFASIRSPSQLWASTLFAMALGALPYGLIRAIYSRERSRAFWVGFTTVGSLYFVTALGPWFRDEWGPRMVTSAALDMLYSKVSPTNTSPAWLTQVMPYTLWSSGTQVVTSATTANSATLGTMYLNPAFVDSTATASAPGSSGVAGSPAPAQVPPVQATAVWPSVNSISLVAASQPTSGFRARWAAWTEVDRNDGVGWQLGQFAFQSTAPFRRIGHSLFTVAFAAAGGAFAARRYSKMIAATPRPATPAEPA